MTVKRLLLSGIACVAIGSCKHSSAPTDMGGGSIVQVLITPSSAAIGVGHTVALHATITGPVGISQQVTWQSLSTSIATVSSTGVVTGVAEGPAVIRAAWFEDPDQFATIQIQVTTIVGTDSNATGSARVAKHR